MERKTAEARTVNPETGTVLSMKELEELANRPDPDGHDIAKQVAACLVEHRELDDLTNEELGEDLEATLRALRRAVAAMKVAVPDHDACRVCLNAALDRTEYKLSCHLGRLALSLWNRGLSWTPTDKPQTTALDEPAA
jgi:hypothetical protein